MAVAGRFALSVLVGRQPDTCHWCAAAKGRSQCQVRRQRRETTADAALGALLK
jgi:hypothetical protein